MWPLVAFTVLGLQISSPAASDQDTVSSLSGPILASRTAFVMICRHLPGPVRTTDFWSVSSGTSSSRLITEVLHPENLLTEPFSLNCKQIGKFECDAISLQ